jgi:hypothetical protein
MHTHIFALERSLVECGRGHKKSILKHESPLRREIGQTRGEHAATHVDTARSKFDFDLGLIAIGISYFELLFGAHDAQIAGWDIGV